MSNKELQFIFNKIKNVFDITISQYSELLGVSKARIFELHKTPSFNSIEINRLYVLNRLINECPDGYSLSKLKMSWYIELFNESFLDVLHDDAMSLDDIYTKLLHKMSGLPIKVKFTPNPNRYQKPGVKNSRNAQLADVDRWGNTYD
jgi:hypothetical protein